MRGISFLPEEMLRLFLVLLILFGVVIIVIGPGINFLNEYIQQFCEDNPQFCTNADFNYTSMDVRKAMQSMNALQCAINSVGVQDSSGWNNCVEKLRVEPRSPISGAVLAQEDDDYANATVQCYGSGDAYSLPSSEAGAIQELGNKILQCYYRAKTISSSTETYCSKISTSDLSESCFRCFPTCPFLHE